MIISWFDKYIMVMAISLDEVPMETLCTIFATFLEIEVYSKLKKKKFIKKVIAVNMKIYNKFWRH